MQLFCVSHGIASVGQDTLVGALRRAGSVFPRFADGPSFATTSASGATVVAAVHHPDDMVGPRTYRAQQGDVVVGFDGLPVHPRGGWRGHDASDLLAHWAELPAALGGQFTLFRADLARDEVAFVTDALGTAPLYHVKHQGGHLVANSVEALRLVTGADTPSPLGVSSFAALGWAAGEATLLADVAALDGGHEYRLSGSGLDARGYLTAATVAAHARSGRRIDTDEVVRDLLDLTSAAVSAGLPIQCGLTAGRDTRFVLALLRACGAEDVRFYTDGHAGDPDVEGARRIARELRLAHEVRSRKVLDELDWRRLATMFVEQTDGLSSLIQIGDYNDQLSAPATLGLRTPGLGGEIGRCGIGRIRFAANVPLFTSSSRIQREALLAWARAYAGLWTPEALDTVERHVRSFVRDRRAEGWKTRELAETYYAFDRVTRWGSASIRRVAGTDDFFSPFCSRAFVDYSFSLTPGERYVEAPHYRILSALSPELRDLPFAKPWRPQRSERAALSASSELVRTLMQPLGRVRRRRDAAPPEPSTPYWAGWLDGHAPALMELCLSVPQSPLWNWIDRSAVERAFRADPAARAPLREPLMRVATLAWYFHGRHLP